MFRRYDTTLQSRNDLGPSEGSHKYVLIRAHHPTDGAEQYIVTSRTNAAYHRNAAEPVIEALERAGYYDVDVIGGGRLTLDTSARRIAIFGFSYGFGRADHSLSQQVVQEDPRYKDFHVTISNEGY